MWTANPILSAGNPGNYFLNEAETMKINSKTFLLGTVVGIMVSFIIFAILGVPPCITPILGITVACYMAKVVTPQDGAIMGAMVPIPLWIYFIFQLTQSSLPGLSRPDPYTIFMIGFLIIFLVSVLGSFYGLIMGGIFRSTRGNDIDF
jgi:hypothetical protein